jgi:hypothetical protein
MNAHERQVNPNDPGYHPRIGTEAIYADATPALGKRSRAANIPGRMPTRPVACEGGMPGVRVGQSAA